MNKLAEDFRTDPVLFVCILELQNVLTVVWKYYNILLYMFYTTAHLYCTCNTTIYQDTDNYSESSIDFEAASSTATDNRTTSKSKSLEGL